MNIAIMQPYFFPYVGYFQLMASVDRFVVLDDVNFIKGGWINRNRILLNNRDHLFTLRLQGASPNLLINQISICEPEQSKRSVADLFRNAYRGASHFRENYPLVEDALMSPEENLSAYLTEGLKKLARGLGMRVQFDVSSRLEKDNSLKGQDRIIEICKVLGAKKYVNPPGGKQLYDEQSFAQTGIELYFLKPGRRPYKQFSDDFVPDLSIVDILMFNSIEKVKEELQQYEWVRPSRADQPASV